MAGCGACTHAENPTQISVPDTSAYTVGDAARVWQGRWKFAVFPGVPCSSPHLIYWEYRKDGGSWTQPGKPVPDPPCYLNGGESDSQNATGSVWYTRNVNFAEAGTYDLRIRQICGAWYSVTETIVVSAALAASRMLSTPAMVIS